MSLFKKPKRNVRQRQNFSDEEDEKAERNSVEEDESFTELQSSIEKFKQGKKKSNKKKENTSSSKDDSEKKSSLLSFDDFEAEADDGEIFKVKKSSQSRRLMKQIKAERKKQKERLEDNNHPPLPPQPPEPPPPPSISGTTIINDDEDEIGVRVKNNLVINKQPQDEMRTLSGYEAEALHMEEEDEDDSEKSDDEKKKDPLQEILQRGAIPDANAIYEARKRRQALREKGETNNAAPGPNQRYISLKSSNNDDNHHSHQDQESDDEEARIIMSGVRSNEEVRKESFERLHSHETDEKDDHYRWEEQQIRKAMKGSMKSESTSPNQGSGHSTPNHQAMGGFSRQEPKYVHREAPISYNLEGIKDRLKKRLADLDEVNRRHLSDAEKIDNDLFESHNIIEDKKENLPRIIKKHHFYQDLRGYVTDLVECFNEKLLNIKFVESKYHKIKADMHQKLVERRREDVRDQMRELSSNNSKPLQITAEENNEEWLRQRRAAEREGRRRRRAQLRAQKSGQLPPHNDGLSSDDELSSHDQATISKSRQEVENQARTIMADVVEEFSTVEGVLERMEEWKTEDSVAYSEAFVPTCLPKMISPLITLHLLFWNPLEEHVSIDDMDWHNRLAMYSLTEEEKVNDDNKILSHVIEKVLLVKINQVVKAAYDPMSTSQTLRITQLLSKLRSVYPTLTGTSKQVRELLNSVVDKIKACVDNDVYIPLGYSKQ